MQDIRGCRAVLASVDEVRKVEAPLKKNRPPVRVSDYIEAPRAISTAMELEEQEGL